MGQLPIVILMQTTWTRDETVRAFVASPPNERLVQLAAAEIARRHGRATALDIGCGAARNIAPLVSMGWRVLGIDTSRPMLHAAQQVLAAPAPGRAAFAVAPMHALPAASGAFDLVIAHGVWNLAQRDAEFRAGIAEAARVLAPDGVLFVFTFSRHTLAPDAQPVAGERLTFTDFAGEPQCFVTEGELRVELSRAGFVADARILLVEHNRPSPGALRVRSGPVIWEGCFRKADAQKGEHA